MRSTECSSQGGRSSHNWASGRISPMQLYVFGSMKWWQNHSDVITISIIWRMIIGKGRVEGNNGSRRSYWWQGWKEWLGICTQQENTGHGTYVLFCVLPSFVLIDNKYILSCVIIRSPLNKSNEELKMKQWCLYLHSSFSFFQDYAIKAEIIWSYYHLSSEDQNKKNV